MADSETFVIVGAGLAGAKAAEALREEGFDGRIVLLGAESERPYERPPLSKDYLRGESRARGHLRPPRGLLRRARHRAADRRASRESRRAARRASCSTAASGSATTGCCSPPAPSRAGCPARARELDGIHYLRTLADSRRARASASTPGGRLVVIGAGWIGCEVAASARQKGLEVTLVERVELPLERVLGPESARSTATSTATTASTCVPRRASRLRGRRPRRAGPARATAARSTATSSSSASASRRGRSSPRPPASRSTTASSSTSGSRRASPGVFAAGDVANAAHPFYGRRLRVEHWANALEQGPAAARSDARPATSRYDERPLLLLRPVRRRHGVLRATRPSWDEVVFRGDPASRRVHRLLAARRARRRRDERQRLGRQRRRSRR